MLPAMEPFGVAADADRSAEELAQTRLGEKLFARTIADDAAVSHENDALDLRQYVAQVMRDHDQAGSLAGKTAEGFAQFALCSEVEGVGWLVEQELPRAVNQRTRNHDAAFLACGHRTDKLASKMLCFDAIERFPCAGAHFIGDMQVGPQGGCREESSDHSVEASGDRGALAGQIASHGARTDDAEVTAQLNEIPTLTPEDAHVHVGLDDGIELAGHREDKRGFSATIGTEDGDVLASTNRQVDVTQDDTLASRDVDAAHFEKFVRAGFDFDHH